MQLYTVKLLLCKMVSKFGPKGELLEQVETDIEHVMHDLPWQTAQMYRDTSAEGKCEIVRQVMGVKPAYSEKRRENVYVGKSAPAAPAKPTKSAADRRAEAAASGDLSAAISR